MPSAPVGSPHAAQRLFAMSQPIGGTIAESYLRKRGITALPEADALRFHPNCYYRPGNDAPTEVWPALIAAVTDLAGTITGAHRTWLDPSGNDKAPLDTPRRAMGHLLGHGVRFGAVIDVMAAGEGVETILSLCCAVPGLPMVAALSASHLAAVLFPATLRRLYVARDRDPAGDVAVATLTDRAQSAGIEALTAHASARRFQRRPAPARCRRASRGLACAARPGRCVTIPDVDRRGWAGRMSLRWVATVRAVVPSRKAAAPRPSRGRSDGSRAGPATAVGGYFPPPESDQADAAAPRKTVETSGFASRSKIAAARRPPLRSGRCR